jgi:hypothetical protein
MKKIIIALMLLCLPAFAEEYGLGEVYWYRGATNQRYMVGALPLGFFANVSCTGKYLAFAVSTNIWRSFSGSNLLKRVAITNQLYRWRTGLDTVTTARISQIMTNVNGGTNAYVWPNDDPECQVRSWGFLPLVSPMK